MRIITLQSAEEMQAGISNMNPVPKETIFVFPRIQPGAIFHSEGVLEDFEIAFLDDKAGTILFAKVHPPETKIIAPPGTVTVVESAVGVISGIGMKKLQELIRL